MRRFPHQSVHRAAGDLVPFPAELMPQFARAMTPSAGVMDPLNFPQISLIFPRCMIPRFDGVIFSLEWKEALWDKFVMAAPRPRTPSEQQYSDRKL